MGRSGGLEPGGRAAPAFLLREYSHVLRACSSFWACPPQPLSPQRAALLEPGHVLGLGLRHCRCRGVWSSHLLVHMLHQSPSGAQAHCRCLWALPGAWFLFQLLVCHIPHTDWEGLGIFAQLLLTK